MWFCDEGFYAIYMADEFLKLMIEMWLLCKEQVLVIRSGEVVQFIMHVDYGHELVQESLAIGCVLQFLPQHHAFFTEVASNV